MSLFVPVFLPAAATPSPTPFPDYTGNPNLITPGVWGFIAILVVAIFTILLLVDMTRRIRRSRYREEVRAKLAEEQEEADARSEALRRKSARAGGRVNPAVAAPEQQPTQALDEGTSGTIL